MMRGGRLGRQLALRLLPVALLAVIATAAGVVWLLQAAERRQARELAAQTLLDIHRKMDGVVTDRFAAWEDAFQLRAADGALRRESGEGTGGDWRRDRFLFLIVDREGRIISRDARGARVSASSVAPGERLEISWGKPRPDRLHAITARIDQSASSYYLGGPAVAPGVALTEAGHWYIVAWLTPVEPAALAVPMLWAAAAALLLVGGGALITARFNRRIDDEIAAMVQVLDGIERQGFSGRVGGGASTDLARLATAINAMIGRVAELTMVLDTIGRGVAHDLRTPLLVARGLVEAPPDAAALAALRARLAQLLGRCEALLAMADASAGQDLPRTPIALDAEIRMIVDDMIADQAEDRGMALDLDLTPLVLHGQRAWFQRLLLNLLQNAITHGAPGTAIAVQLAEADGHALIRISNAAATAAPEGGLRSHGLGTGYARFIVHRHGGTIAFNRAADQFLTTIRLPLVFHQHGGAAQL
jgi:signal transduction histidine kinase